MRLALVRRRWVPDGGGERFTALLAAGLGKAGCSVTVVSAGWAANGGGVQHHAVPVSGRSEFLALLSFTVNVARHLRAARYDLVQSHEKLMWQDVYRAGNGCHREWLRQRFRHHPSSREVLVRLAPHHRLVLGLERYLLRRRRYRVIVANSGRVRDDLMRNYNVPGQHVRVIHNGVDLERYDPSNRDRYRAVMRRRFEVPSEATLLLFMGSGFERKGLDYLLRALALTDEHVRLVVAGRDPDEPRYRSLATALGVAGRVGFLGAVAEPERAYAAADAFVLPTIYEPFSNACLEALAAGLPVITTRANGVSELLTGGLAALTLDDPSDHRVLAERIRGIAARGDAEALGPAARAVAETRSIEGVVVEFLQVYRELGVAV